MTATVRIGIDHDHNSLYVFDNVEDANDVETRYAKRAMSMIQKLAMEPELEVNPVFDLGTEITFEDDEDGVQIDITDNGKGDIIGGKACLSYSIAYSVVSQLEKDYTDYSEYEFDEFEEGDVFL